jgi:hypothetical protein
MHRGASGLRYRRGAFITVALMLCAAVASSRTVPKDVEWYILNGARFTQADLAMLEGGGVIARAELSANDTEALVVAAVKIYTDRKRAADYYGQFIADVDGQVTLGFGKFNKPATLADVQRLSLSAEEVDELKSCKPGDCDVRIGGAAIDQLQRTIDWTASDRVARVNDFVRRATVDYVNRDLQSGDAALTTYNDRQQPVSLETEWRGIVASSPYFHYYNATLEDYLLKYPRSTLPGARDVFYWIKENYGMKPVLSLVHGVVYETPATPDRTVIIQKQLYADHYYDGSLAMTTIVGADDGGRPVTYLLYGNRSRGDLLKGGFGGLKRKLVLSQAQKAAEQTLGAVKSALEQR